MSYPDLPKRHIECGIRVGADNTDSLILALSQIVLDLRQGRGMSVICGGCDYGYEARMETRTNEGMTHEKYFAELDVWIAAEKATAT